MQAYRVLVVGVGSIGERHTRCFQTTGRAVVSIVDTNSELRHTVAQRYGVREFSTYEKALADAPAVVVICTPAPFHVPLATHAISAGAHVLIEKPLSTSETGIAELARVAQQRNRLVGVAYVYRAFPELQKARERLLSGEFGRPVQISVVSGQNFPTYRPAYRDIYYARRDLGGGAIQDAITHLLNLGEWLVGPIRSLVCDAAHMQLPGVEVEDTVHMLTRHQLATAFETMRVPDNGSNQSDVPMVFVPPPVVMGSFSLNQYQAPNEIVVQIVCTQGTLRIELHRNRLLWMKQPGSEWQTEEFAARERDEVYIRQANAFLDAVEHRVPLACPLSDGFQTLRVNLAAIKSATQGCWERVEPSTH